ncbi:MAG: V-type ATPase subunit [archaeon]|nr:V-type ATPase subunit [archaeon]
MRVTVNHYAYTLVKISSLKKLIITPDDFRELERIKDASELLERLDKFFPGLFSYMTNEELNLIEIEKALYKIYFEIFEKILKYSEVQIQEFLKSLLLRYEIWNIKTYIVGNITNLSPQTLKNETLNIPERLIDQVQFIDKLYTYSNLDDGIEFLKSTQYRDPIDRGWYYYKQKNEIFLLEALLDKYYMTQLIKSLKNYSGLEKRVFKYYIDILNQKYNLILVYRSIRNNIPKDLLKQLIIYYGNMLSSEILSNIAYSKDINDFSKNIKKIFTEEKYLKLIKKTPFMGILFKNQKYLKSIQNSITVDNPISYILSELDQNIFRMLEKESINNLRVRNIENILTLIFGKELEIFKVLALFVKIFHKIE